MIKTQVHQKKMNGKKSKTLFKQYRAIATRCDKAAKNFLGAIYLAASVI